MSELITDKEFMAFLNEAFRNIKITLDDYEQQEIKLALNSLIRKRVGKAAA